MVNYIRSLHGLKPVVYESSVDNESMEGCLNIVASGEGGHSANPSSACYTAAGARGREFSNLFQSWSSQPLDITSESSIIGWMIDDHTDPSLEDRVGHRRAIVNPFLTRISFGRADGQVKGGTNYITAMNLHYQNFVNGNITDQDIEYVAYPYQNYPPQFVNKNFYLNFNVIYNKHTAFGNQNVNFSGATVTMKDENDNSLQVHSIRHDNEGWGSLPNNLSWKATGLQNNIRYEVSINNVNVNGVIRSYNYWFKLTDLDDTNPPNAPQLSIPANNAVNQNLKVQLAWELTQNTSSYRLQLSKSADFSSFILNETNLVQNAHVSPDLEYNTQYYWRAAAENKSGVSPWSETWSFTTTVPAPETAELLEPANNAENVALMPLLKWSPVPNAATYQLQVADKSDFGGWSVIISRQDIEDSEFLVPENQLEEKTEYFWRVKAKNAGGESEWSSIWSFKTLDPVSVTKKTENDSILIYPNPANSIVNIKFKSQTKDNIRIDVFNILGIKVKEISRSVSDNTEYSIEIDVKDLPIGMYNVRYSDTFKSHRSILQIVR